MSLCVVRFPALFFRCFSPLKAFLTSRHIKADDGQGRVGARGIGGRGQLRSVAAPGNESEVERVRSGMDEKQEKKKRA